MSALPDGDGVGIVHASPVMARVILRPGPSAVDGVEGQRMISRVARFPGSLMPPSYIVASAHKHSARLVLWTDATDRPRQRSQPSPSRLIRPRHFGLAELQRFFRSR